MRPPCRCRLCKAGSHQRSCTCCDVLAGHGAQNAGLVSTTFCSLKPLGLYFRTCFPFFFYFRQISCFAWALTSNKLVVVISLFPPRPVSTSGILGLTRFTMDTVFLLNVCRGQQSSVLSCLARDLDRFCSSFWRRNSRVICSVQPGRFPRYPNPVFIPSHHVFHTLNQNEVLLLVR